MYSVLKFITLKCNTRQLILQNSKIIYNSKVSFIVPYSTLNRANSIDFCPHGNKSPHTKIQKCNIGGTRKRNQQSPNSSWPSFFVVVTVGSFAILLLKYFKSQKEGQLKEQMVRSMGTPALGGDFELIDCNGKLFSNKDLLGNYALIYFGFTHCPDICPEELEKLSNAVSIVNRNKQFTCKLRPVFISIDPERDTPEAVKEYLSDFHPHFIGLTGSKEQVEDATRAFRVYYSQGPEDNEGDYIMDHSVVMYLLNSDGEFSEYYTQTKSAGEIASNISAKMAKQVMQDIKAKKN